jgi:hypothetical protein
MSIVLLPAAASEAGTDWAVVLVTALGGSLLGGVVGGLLTTWLRGQIEKNEAWRTRLIDAADSYCGQRMQAFLAASDCLEFLESPDDEAWDSDRDIPLDRGLAEIAKARDAENVAEVAFERVRLLFGHDSEVAETGQRTLDNSKWMLQALEGLGTSPEGWSLARPIEVKWTGSDKPKRVAARGFLDTARRDHGEFMRACQTVLHE